MGHHTLVVTSSSLIAFSVERCYMDVSACSNTGMMRSNSTQVMDVCVYSVFVLCGGLATG
jgi:hypothetical protein